ncbi:mRNA-capping enzyme subunit beta [Mortierella sp. AD011]|nr:mRNA-capping enzyme subunit beta [Mortierella sp. AD010]KAF9391737.1 mRNA-capping enzyme subunit beta [Mortierella sp. AD011]
MEAAKKRPREEEEDSQDPAAKQRVRPQNSNAPETTATPASVSQNTPSGATPPTGAPSSSGHQQQRPNQGQHPNPAHPSQPYRSSKLEHAFFGIEVMDDVVKAIGDFLLQYCNQPNVEIEAKLGVIIDNNTRQRLELPVRNEVVLTPNSPYLRYRFVSDMTLILYKHTYEVDQFFQGPGGKVRVTKDQKTNKVIENGIVKKERIANLDVYSPRNAFDFRVSVNVEIPESAPSGTPQFERNKDRISYRLNNFKIDLTQVKSGNASNGNNQPHNYSQMRQPSSNQQDLTHELEIEFIHPEELIRERDIRTNGGARPDRFYEVVGRFVNNIRGLIIQGNPPPHQHQQQHPQQRLG